jgi:hypothetical protein
MSTFTGGHSQQTVPNPYGALLRLFVVSERSKLNYVTSCRWLRVMRKVPHAGGSRLLTMLIGKCGHRLN